ncbi:MAG TPA: ABC-F family ATP-binding cassette domain-containing protein [Chitinophagales bacterium]|nr:ABC-F family ATP-binding cassette domain-containing protein [Chitinophagales bacterium]HMU68881.1 ABC-F family ATP-binding cassette domain-containing protein [Chitinophagales bacterium]HMZ87850.1 ABC-F family ATP-binding cassette domain-containing protein [Chitinophagales bacterium]HNA56579.1 ABC-F family ATP-binding cassette domain-containing protein [Chitinophagales bacterium]HNE45723.1 ABC-F family ATP-binding cassette domain-containing protein [Chitinophagales bacterium]
MIAVQNLSISFGGEFLFEDVSFTLKDNDRVGLVGKNGAGKSTLMKILSGLQQPDSGQVILPKDSLIGFLHQDLAKMKGKTVMEEARTAFDEALAFDKRLHEIEHDLTVRTDYESDSYHDLIEEMNEIVHRLEIIDVGSIDKQMELVLMGLGFMREDFNKPVETFSGGWQMRIELAKILLSKPELVLLDEPTNHLDIESIQWLETYLETYPGAIILVSHDRTFLDNVTKRTIEIVSQKIYDYNAAYSTFVELRKERIDQQKAAQKNQEKYVEHTERLIEKFRAKANKAKFAQSLIKKLDKLEEVEVDDEETATIHFYFPKPPRSGRISVEGRGVSKSYGEKEVLRLLDFEIHRGDKIAFVGKNGEGKSTLSKMIAGIEKYTGELTIGHNVHLGYYAQNQAETLSGDDTVFDTIDKVAAGEIRSHIRTLLGAFLFGGEASFKKVKVLSGGEKSRLAMCKLLLEPYNLLVLDEPTNHLDMRSKDVLKNALANFDGTVIVVSHDRDFLKGITNRVFEFKDKTIKEYIGDIYDYLDAKKISNLAELEMTEKQPKKKEAVPEVVQEQKVQYADKKQKEKELQRVKKAIEKSEQEIKTLEAEIKTMEATMNSADFYNNSNTADFFTKYNTTKQSHESKMSDWEKLQEELERLNVN